jgi:hypothetical protein
MREYRGYGRRFPKTCNSYYAMLARCYYTKHAHYKKYGGRGITVCLGWRIDFRNFLRDMGERPDEMTLDRIDNNGPYSKKNCRWATRAEQHLNRSDIIWVEYEGRNVTLRELAVIAGIPYHRLYGRYRVGYRGKMLVRRRE